MTDHQHHISLDAEHPTVTSYAPVMLRLAVCIIGLAAVFVLSLFLLPPTFWGITAGAAFIAGLVADSMIWVTAFAVVLRRAKRTSTTDPDGNEEA